MLAEGIFLQVVKMSIDLLPHLSESICRGCADATSGPATRASAESEKLHASGPETLKAATCADRWDVTGSAEEVGA